MILHVSDGDVDVECDCRPHGVLVLRLKDISEGGASCARPCFRGALLDGLDVAEMKYRLGASDKEIMDAFHIGRSKLYDDLSAIVEYLDFIGPEHTFHLDEERPAELPPAVDVAPSDVGPHCDVYGDIDALVANCGHGSGIIV